MIRDTSIPYPASCPGSKSNKKASATDSDGGMGSSFQFRHRLSSGWGLQGGSHCMVMFVGPGIFDGTWRGAHGSILGKVVRLHVRGRNGLRMSAIVP